MQEDNMKVSKQKMDQIREENRRLKLRLCQVMEDYHSLKMQLNVEDYNHPKNSTDNSVASEDDASEFVSLSLGRSYVEAKKEKSSCVHNEGKNPNDGLELGLDCKFHSDNSTDDTLSKNETDEKGNNEASTECCDDTRKNSRSGDDEILQDSPNLKKPRVSVRAFCNTQTMNDGCQWRKYGQKIAKGNPCPRAYYRCTVSSSCPVRKQVQRCIDDMSILTTTYEGTHNHPLPPSATTMASTTSAAAAMLNCPSSSAAATSSGFKFTSSDNLATSSRFPNITISSMQSHPTVILDLTAPNHYPSHNSKLFSSGLFSNALSSPTSLNFSTTSNSLFGPISSFSKNISSSSYSQPFVFNNNVMSSSKHAANIHGEKSIAAATMAITNNPGFQTALTAAITSLMGSGNVQGRNNSGLDFQLNFSQPQKGSSNGSIGITNFFN